MGGSKWLFLPNLETFIVRGAAIKKRELQTNTCLKCNFPSYISEFGLGTDAGKLSSNKVTPHGKKGGVILHVKSQ